MACIYFSGRGFRGYICGVPLLFRLPLADGGRLFMEWHNYHGPTFFRDRQCVREIQDWWDNPLICDALDWFCKRGNKA